MTAWSIVLAAGRGERFGEAKQFRTLGGRRLVDRVVDTLRATCEGVVVVLPPGVAWDGPPVQAAVPGGALRADSLRAGLAAVPETVPYVVVHDAAHPLVTPPLVGRVLRAVHAGADAAAPVLPVHEAVRRLRDGALRETIPREGLVLVQTPQAFRTAALRAAHAALPTGSDDSALVEAAGGRLVAVAGDPANLHVTTPAELALAEALLAACAPA